MTAAEALAGLGGPIVIIDSDTTHVELLRFELGERLQHAATFADGLALVHRLRPCVVLLEYTLPRTVETAAEMLRSFRRAVGPEALLMVHTRDEDTADAARCIRAGADAYVTKGAMVDLWESISSVRRK